MPLCPSSLCKKENPEGNTHCNHCGIDLRMDKDEILGRDIFYEALTEFVKEKNDSKYRDLLGITRKEFDYIMEKSAGRIFLMMGKIIAEKKETINEQKKESNKKDMEEEKLKVLKEISKNLQEIAKRKR